MHGKDLDRYVEKNEMYCCGDETAREQEVICGKEEDVKQRERGRPPLGNQNASACNEEKSAGEKSAGNQQYRKRIEFSRAGQRSEARRQQKKKANLEVPVDRTRSCNGLCHGSH